MVSRPPRFSSSPGSSGGRKPRARCLLSMSSCPFIASAQRTPSINPAMPQNQLALSLGSSPCFSSPLSSVVAPCHASFTCFGGSQDTGFAFRIAERGTIVQNVCRVDSRVCLVPQKEVQQKRSRDLTAARTDKVPRAVDRTLRKRKEGRCHRRRSSQPRAVLLGSEKRPPGSITA